MTRRSLALLLIASLGPMLGGCSGFQPFWTSSEERNQAAQRSVEGPLTLARLAEQRGKTLEAERLYRSILERDPSNPGAYHRLAVVQCKKGRFEDANAYFDQALRLKPDDPTLICDAGYCQYLQQRNDLAEPLFRQALSIDPQHESATNNLALVLGEKGDDRAAFALFRQMGSEAKAHVNMGFVYTRRGDLEKAKEAYSRALSLDPRMIAAGEALVQLAQFERNTRDMVAQSNRANAARMPQYASVHAEPTESHRQAVAVNHSRDQRVEYNPGEAAAPAYEPLAHEPPAYEPPGPVVASHSAAFMPEYHPGVNPTPVYEATEPVATNPVEVSASRYAAGMDF
ncbi:MAG: tetratricopeptide repeat protein, partial [Patescibacteria group bacterium]|nr:tetratricopeptide repeat protein [Patescibacteria group bacterium]